MFSCPCWVWSLCCSRRWRRPVNWCRSVHSHVSPQRTGQWLKHTHTQSYFLWSITDAVKRGFDFFLFLCDSVRPRESRWIQNRVLTIILPTTDWGTVCMICLNNIEQSMFILSPKRCGTFFYYHSDVREWTCMLCVCVRAWLTCAGLLVLIECVSFVAVAGEGARRADTDLFTVVFPLSTQVNG